MRVAIMPPTMEGERQLRGKREASMLLYRRPTGVLGLTAFERLQIGGSWLKCVERRFGDTWESSLLRVESYKTSLCKKTFSLASVAG